MMQEQDCPFFEKPSTKAVGVTALAFLVGLALGNGWATREAMVGLKTYLDDKCGRTIKSKVEAHVKEDRAVFGFAPEDLQPTKK